MITASNQCCLSPKPYSECERPGQPSSTIQRSVGDYGGWRQQLAPAGERIESDLGGRRLQEKAEAATSELSSTEQETHR